jgi:hypothetical protein
MSCRFLHLNALWLALSLGAYASARICAIISGANADLAEHARRSSPILSKRSPACIRLAETMKGRAGRQTL